jgi:site-specific recombinase XerD
MLLTDALDDYLMECRTLQPKTRRWYADKLGRFRQWCCAHGIKTLEQLSGREVRKFLDSLYAVRNTRTGEPITDYTHHGYAQVLRQFLNWCGREGYCPPTLHQRVKLPRVEQRVIRTLTKAQIEALFDACTLEGSAVLVARDRALLAVLLSTGIRAAELCSLTLDNLRLDNPNDPHLIVRGKGKKERAVGMGEIAYKYLRRYLRVHPQLYGTAGKAASKTSGNGKDGNDCVFLNVQRKPMTPGGVTQVLYRLGRWADLPDDVEVAAHNLRRTFAVLYMQQEDADVFKLKELMGHASIQTTLIYLRDYKQHAARRGTNPLDRLL